MKSRSHFQFRQFSVSDDRCSMKVGTDAVLLGAWADVKQAQRILDIGTGSGVIALIAAQRTMDALIDGADIQEAECIQAKANAMASPWSDRITIIQSAIQDFTPTYRYDAIICNPPYFVDSLLPPNDGRTTARHTVTLTHDALIKSVNRLLSDTGIASFIFPPEQGQRFKHEMEAHDFCTSRICLFRTRAKKNVERMLLAFKRSTSNVEAVKEEELLLYADGNQWTQAYEKLTGEFYLPKVILEPPGCIFS